MEKIEDLFGKKWTEKAFEKQLKKRGSERDDLIGQFIEKINSRQRLEKKKEYLASFIAYKLSHLKVKDLYYLKSICEQSDNWYQTFWGSIKIK